VTKNVRILLLIGVLATQSCQRNGQQDEPALNQSQPDLSKAASYNMQLGLGYLSQGNRQRAKIKLLLALDQEPKSADINAAMAYYLEQTHDDEQAKKYYLNALSLSHHSGAQLNNYGAFLCRKTQYLEAERYFLQAVRDPQYINTAGAYENAGLCALAIPDRQKARVYFTNALNQDPEKRESLYELVVLETSDGKDKAAMQLLEQHPNLVLNDRVLLDFAKEAARKLGEFDMALQYESMANKVS